MATVPTPRHVIRGSLPWMSWLRGFAIATRLGPSDLVDIALCRYAETQGYTPPPPRLGTAEQADLAEILDGVRSMSEIRASNGLPRIEGQHVDNHHKLVQDLKSDIDNLPDTLTQRNRNMSTGSITNHAAKLLEDSLEGTGSRIDGVYVESGQLLTYIVVNPGKTQKIMIFCVSLGDPNPIESLIMKVKTGLAEGPTGPSLATRVSDTPTPDAEDRPHE
jgi:hypothetical protein